MINLSLNKKVIIFGFIFTFFSSFGQSFFIGLFNPSIRNEINISHGQFGTIYALATILSSTVLIWFGKKIDEFKLIRYAFLVVFFLFFSAIFFSFINSIYLLFLGIFFLRFSGQGMMSHTSTTAISRYFNKSRGKSLSTIWFGLSTAEFISPILIIFFLSTFSWRVVWQGIAGLILLVLPFIIYFTIRNINFDTREESSNQRPELKEVKSIKNWTRKEVLLDFKFYIISLTMLAMPWIATGIFVYQSFISESKGWSAYTIPQSFMVYSIMSIIALFLSGILVDKFTSRKLIPFMNLPLLLAMIILLFFKSPISSFIFLGLVGVSNGLANVLGSSTWAEIYGVRYIGSIKALTTSLMVFSTAFGTAIFGLLIDKGFSIEIIALVAAIYVVVSTILLLFFRNALKPVILRE